MLLFVLLFFVVGVGVDPSGGGNAVTIVPFGSCCGGAGAGNVESGDCGGGQVDTAVVLCCWW